MAELHETMYGKKLLEGDIPSMASSLKRIADALEDMNEISAKNTTGQYQEKFLMTTHAHQGKISRILNTIKNSTAEDLQGVISAIEQDELGDSVEELDKMLDAHDPEWDEEVRRGR